MIANCMLCWTKRNTANETTTLTLKDLHNAAYKADTFQKQFKQQEQNIRMNYNSM